MSVIISVYSKAAFKEFLNQVYSVIKVHNSSAQVGLAICSPQRNKERSLQRKEEKG